MPLEILAAPLGTEVLVLEAAMRGFGQIAELARICEPDVGVITNVGPVHLEQMGSLEGVARAKAELLEGVHDGGTAVVPSDEPLLEPYLRAALRVVTFGPGGDVSYEGSSLRGSAVPDTIPRRHVILARGERVELELPFDQRHHLLNTLAAVAAAQAVGVTPGGRLDVRFSGLRGERVALGVGAMVINDCYNANPLSMRAALDDLASHESGGRRIAVLGDMLELGPAEDEHHREVGAYAATAGVDVLVTVGPRAARMLDAFEGEAYAVADAAEAAALAAELIGAGDVVLVKGSRGVGLEVVAEALGEAEGGG
jgi:UDP-N-acetylmuramoyl-tripeptide--D-alanyl-D-alanine ligase